MQQGGFQSGLENQGLRNLMSEVKDASSSHRVACRSEGRQQGFPSELCVSRLQTVGAAVWREVFLPSVNPSQKPSQTHSQADFLVHPISKQVDNQDTPIKENFILFS